MDGQVTFEAKIEAMARAICRSSNGGHEMGLELYLPEARAAAEAIGLREGSVVVPGEPTPEMVDAGVDPFRTENVRDSSVNGKCGRIYRAMIAASPT